MSFIKLLHKMNIMNITVPKILFISLIFLIIFAFNKLSSFVNAQSQVFSSAESDLKYLIDDASNVPHVTSLIRFIPESLNFYKHSIGIPNVETVIVENLNDESSIQMLSISGNTVHFHCSFFEDKIIPPHGNTSFEIVFLARHEGSVNNTLYIHTSLGSFKYRVTAYGVSNPFRLRPFIGAKVPLNSSYAPLIHIYNPHITTLQLTEMYTSGGGLHLELPNGDAEASKEFWQIPPFETKTIMRANFLAKSEKNHTAYIRIKTNSSEENFVVLPLEVEVSSAPGIYFPIDLIDFGVLRTNDEPKTVMIQVFNSGTKHIQIQNVIATPVNDALNIEFSPIRVAPDIYHSTDIATVTLNPSKITQCSKQCNGKIVVKSKNNQYKLAIPYRVTLLQGYLSYNESHTQFYIQPESKVEKRTLKITNHFNFSIIIHSVTLRPEAKRYFKVSLVSPTIELKQNATEEAIKITYVPSPQLTNLETNFRIHTNISYFDVPIHAYSGKLELFIPQSLNQSVLDFGAIGLGEKKSMTFAVINNNPVVIRLKYWGCNMSKAFVELMGIEEGNATVIAQKSNFSTLSRKHITMLKPKHYAVFSLHLNDFTEEGLFYGENFVETPFEKLKIPFLLRAVEGNFHSESVVISNCFPARVSSQTVVLSSTFTYQLLLKSVRIIPDDERFHFELNHSFINFGDNMIGKLYFDPIKTCHKMCYCGLDTTKEVGNLWLLGLALHPDTGYIDKELHKLLYTRWTNILTNDKTVNVTLQLQVDGVSSFSIDSHAQLKWPRLVHKNQLKFPITRIGNTTIKEILIENPSSHSIIVQVVLLSDYPNPDAVIELIKLGFHTSFTENELNSAETKIKNFHILNLTSDDVILSHKNIKDNYSVNPDPNSITMTLPIGGRKKISIGFTPKDDSLSSGLLLIRNNLTILDAIYLHGHGGSGILKIGNQLPGHKSVLSFELLEKHLKSCSKMKNSQSGGSYSIEPTFTVQRTFTAVNVGKLSMKVLGFTIGPQTNSAPFTCQGYGFKVINCMGFDLRPNESKKIHIAFTPDFTQSKTRQIMTILTDDQSESLQYALIATVPKNLLTLCNNSMPRPNWEAVLYYCLVTMMTFMMFLAVCVAFFDGDRILNYSFYPVLTTYSMNQYENASVETTPDDISENAFSKNGLNDDSSSKDLKRNDMKQKKGKAKGRNGSKDESNDHHHGQTWTQFLQQKFARRDSSGSDKSNNSARGVQNQNAQKSLLKKEVLNDDKTNWKVKSKKSQKIDKLNDVENGHKTTKRRLNTPLKYENLTNVITSPPPPLPSFPSAFDDDDFVKNGKSNKKSRANSYQNEAVHTSLELPYKPSKTNLNSIGKAKKVKPKEDRSVDDNESYASSNENSIIWENPITTFDSDNAMNELVRQTEIFAEKSQNKDRKNLHISLPSQTKNIKQKHNNDAFKLFDHQNEVPSSNWSHFRSITPPAATTNSYLFDESLLDRRTPPSRFTHFPTEHDWLAELNGTNNSGNSLDHELTHLRETSSPWNSQQHHGISPLTPSKEWTVFEGNESRKVKELWDNTKWTNAAANESSSSHCQTIWNDKFGGSVWNGKKNDNTWGDASKFSNMSSTNLNSNLNPASPLNEASLFNLFGRSLWNPIVSTATNSTPTNATPVTAITSAASNTTSSWSFAPFSLFGSTNTQYTQNNDPNKNIKQ